MPTVLLLPIYFLWKFKLLPPFDFADAALLPLGIWLLLRFMRFWRFSWVDLWVVLFALSMGVHDATSGDPTSGIFEIFHGICEALFPYMAGKLLIEQAGAAEKGRTEMLRRMVPILCVVCVLSMYEYPFKDNLFRMTFKPLFSDQTIPWLTQLRGGFGRISGPYAQGELAGMMLLIAFPLSIFLAWSNDWGERFRTLRSLPLRKSTIVAGIFLLGLYMTQSRGPELGLAFALPIAWIGRTRNVARSALLVLAVMAVCGGVAYKVLSDYAAEGARRAPTSEEQETAAYRVVMVELYLPLAEAGGPWGSGPSFKTVGKYKSVDNEYLLVFITQGYVGLASFLLLSVGTLNHLMQALRHNPRKVDRAFAYTLLGIMVGLLVTISTVYLGLQTMILFFTIAGWAQAVRVRPPKRVAPVFEQVYT
jgi:hypothetical protein